jgi:diguanylate cyclase (GGDEF)-like protein/PAS domain S-box-containing protein
MAKADNIIRLLLVEESVEDAEHVISVVRNSGLAVRPSRATDAREVQAILSEQTIDLVLVSPKSKGIGLRELGAAIDKSGKDIVLLQLLDSFSAESLVDALRQGARDVILRTSSDHLQMVVRREFDNLQARRSLRRMEASLRESERRCHSLLDSSRDPIAYVHEGMHVYANRAYLEIFGFEDFEEIEGTPMLELINPKHADEMKTVLRQISKGEKPPERVNLQARTPDGDSFDAVLEMSEASIEGEACTQIVFRQQTVDAKVAEQLDTLKRQDLVTGLANRQHFLAELDKAVGATLAGKTDQALIYIELDSYRQTLDSIGVGSADLLLAEAAGRLRSMVSDSDLVARFSDHTFTVLANGRSHAECAEFAQSIAKAIDAQIFDVGEQSISMTASIGVCLLTEKISRVQDVLERAAEASRTASEEGGNRVLVFDPSAKDKAAAERDQHWLSLIKDALNKNGFVLFYQPMVSLQGAEGEFYEILLRMSSPKGEIPPGNFLPAAAHHGLLPQIDRWVINKAISILAERLKQGAKCTFFVKISPESIQDGTILQWLAQQLKDARLPGKHLVLEMPESKVVTNLKPARFLAQGLTQLNCGFTLEQFGSGLNSFQLLKHVPARYIKIDRSYMTDLPKSKENELKVRELCDEARRLEREVIAEFVEDAASMSILFSCGVSFVQGNFLQEPEKVMSYEFG